MNESTQPSPESPATESKELCAAARRFVEDPKGYFFTQAVKSDLAMRLSKKLEEQSASGQLDRLYRHEEDWTNFGSNETGTMIH